MPQSQRSRTAETPPAIQVGDTIAYTQKFLERHSQYRSDMAAAQGQVKALHRLESGTILADIEWDKPGLPKRVNVKNVTPKKGTATDDQPVTDCLSRSATRPGTAIPD